MLRGSRLPAGSLSRATLALAAACLIAIGAIASFAILPGPRVESADEHVTDAIYEPTREDFADERSVELVVVESPAPNLLAPSSGIVTDFDCQVGGEMASGSAPIAINGVRKVAIWTAVPLWRNLAPGMEGEDITALQHELRRLGYLDAKPTSRYNSATANAVRAMIRKLTSTRAVDDVLRLEMIVWMPEAAAVVEKCQSFVGARLSQGAPVATVRAAIQSIKIKSMPTDPVPGKRQLSFGGRTLEVSESGEVTDEESIAIVASSEEFEAFRLSGGQTSLRGAYRLAEPLRVYSLPPTALVFGEREEACVLTGDGRPVKVSVVSSSLGRSIVRTLDDQPLPPVQTDGYAEGGCV